VTILEKSNTYDRKESRTHNSTYKKLAVQWLNEALYFVSSFVVVDSFVLRNRQLLLAANLSRQAQDDTATFTIPTKIRATLQPKSKRTFARQTVHCILTLTDLSDTQADPKGKTKRAKFTHRSIWIRK